MLLRAVLVLSLVLTLSACGSRLNPLNWFGGDREQRINVAAVEAGGTVADPRALVTEITQLSVEQTTSGAIVRATGLTPAQGYYDAELLLADASEGTLVFEFRTAPPEGRPTPGVQTIVAGASLSNGELANVRTITVIAQSNRRSVTRR